MGLDGKQVNTDSQGNDIVEWGQAFLAEAAKDKADCEWVLAYRDDYDRSDVWDASQRLDRLNDPDGVVPLVSALVAKVERLQDALGEIRQGPKACTGAKYPKNGRHCRGQRRAEAIAEEALRG